MEYPYSMDYLLLMNVSYGSQKLKNYLFVQIFAQI